jgi:TP901 family phage tail tape measure protein
MFEGLAATLNTVATKTAAKGFEQTEKDYAASMAKIEKIDKEATAALAKSSTKAAQATQKALQRSMPKPLTDAQKKKMSSKEIDDYEKKFKSSMKGMSSSYAKYVKNAEKMGLKVRKAQGGFGTGQSVADFQKKDVEQRKRLINLTKRMVKDEKERIKNLKKKGQSTKAAEAELKALIKQEKAMVNLNEDLTQQERKLDKIKRKGARDERKAEKKRAVDQKKQIQRLKAVQQGFQRIGQVASMTAGKIKAGIQNAFVIGTAAATAFFYKMQPLAQSVMEFEKTITNANSVFNVTQKELHAVSDTMVNFTLKYGVSAQETATGLYQLASAGLSAAESQEVLQHTMKLAMATQGDHNTLAKLTTQTIMGFGMEMTEAGDLTDKFAHTIQKSLVEWQDLASSVKFAMPFFVATGQSIDELLGGLEVLSNRALEAGIAGRGLRQALAQFAKHAHDNESAFAKMGVSILDAEGNMKDLSAIALEAKAAFGDVTDLEALTAMLEDMNVRGATAFALLVQNADEFDSAVRNVANSAGEATRMADIQQESLAMQIQRVKNALLDQFLLADEVGAAQGSLNEFTLRIRELVDEFTKFFIVIGPDGQETYSKHGESIKQFVLTVLEEAVVIIKQLKDVFLDQESGLETFASLLKVATAPLKALLAVIDILGPSSLKWYAGLKVLTALLPISNILTLMAARANMLLMYAISKQVSVSQVSMAGMMVEMGMLSPLIALRLQHAKATGFNAMALWAQAGALSANNKAWILYAAATGVAMLKITAFVIGAKILMDTLGKLGAVIATFAALQYFGALSNMFAWYSKALPPPFAVAATAATGLAGAAIMWKLYNAMQTSMASAGHGDGGGANLPDLKFNKERNYDGGGTFLPTYDNGGMTTEHGMAVLQKGETVIPKTQNMLGGGGITLNMGDVNVQDGEDFAERVAAALPSALQRVNDSGAI